MDGEVVQRLEEETVVAALRARRERQARNTSSTVAQSSSVIRVSMVGLLEPTRQVSQIHERGNPLTAYSNQSVHTA